ncbi:MAG TPA: ribosome biogenesis GTPase Der, partial [Patescibacteria group bacterium]|nr:ribosome biogenesis GTPase Der [Patescibacteria group bacterium]
LINKISGERHAITSPVAGTTRDRQYVDVSWNGKEFTLVDTAGLIFANAELEQNVKKQIDVAKGEADILVFVADSKADPATISREVLVYFRKSKKPVILAINKVDAPNKVEAMLAEFAHLGIKPSFAVSAVTGRGLGDLLDAIASKIEELGLKGEKDPDTGIKVAIVGKPNVGKSTLFNKILGQERSVVSSIPGTTRNPVDSYVAIDGTEYVFIDTAGLKKKTHNQELPDIYSGFHAFKSIRRSDVCIFVLDSVEEISKQDQQIAAEIAEQNKGVIIVANKVDAYAPDEYKPASEAQLAGERNAPRAKSYKTDKKKQSMQDQLKDFISSHFQFLWMSPVFLISAQSDTDFSEILNAVKSIYAAREKTVSPEELKKLLDHTMKVNPPKLIRDQRAPKVFSLNQIGTKPPEFELVVNYSAAISQQFRKAVQNGIIRDLGFWGTPVVLKMNSKDKK